MDLAQGHVISLAALEKPETFAKSGSAGTGFGGSGGKYKAYNLGKGKGMSVMEMVAAMKSASGFDYKYEVVGRRSVVLLFTSLRWATCGKCFADADDFSLSFLFS